jgi:peptide/nickel transport system substrate-binding protein
VDPDQMFRQTYHSRGGQNFGRYSDPKVDQLIEKQRTIFDVRERRVAVTEIVRHLLENAPYTGTSSRGVLSVAQAKVRDWAPESTARYPGHQYEYVWLDT